jgi:hypothetical protein
MVSVDLLVLFALLPSSKRMTVVGADDAVDSLDVFDDVECE